jgi:hypothetical protein
MAKTDEKTTVQPVEQEPQAAGRGRKHKDVDAAIEDVIVGLQGLSAGRPVV